VLCRVVAVIAVLITVVVAGRRPPAGVDRPEAGGFTLGYWVLRSCSAAWLVSS